MSKVSRGLDGEAAVEGERPKKAPDGEKMVRKRSKVSGSRKAPKGENMVRRL